MPIAIAQVCTSRSRSSSMSAGDAGAASFSAVSAAAEDKVRRRAIAEL
ncbi:MAG TPA: hypothetical protein VJ744_05525 [Gaiellaceae bacterium]|nr:hypothetical protein [Gaiellaceae bacterium]